MRIRINFLFGLFLVPLVSIAQDKNVADIDIISQQLVKNLRSAGKDKIFLQANKKVYTVDETIWFKVYTADSLSNRLMNRSKILYVDLVDEKDSITRQLLLDAGNAEQTGAILIDSTLNGYYWLRAYTTSMLLDNINNITVKPVYIVNATGNAKNNSYTAGNVDDKDAKPMLDIFPEGGELIGGANSVVAVRAHTVNGKGMAVSCIVKDNRDTIVARFSTNDQGLGKFSFSPSSYQTYKLYVLHNSNYDSASILPRVNPFAAQVAVTEQNQQYIKARVLLEDSIYAKDYKTYLIGINKDSICFAAVGNGMYEVNIPASNFPAGTGALLLFNGNKELASVRNVYLDKTDISVTVSTDKQNYEPRENAQINITVTDSKGKPELATLSVSVADSRIADTLNDFYDNPFSKLSSEEIDLMMLTQHQNPEHWLNIYAGKNLSPPKYSEEYLSINGKLVSKKQEPLPDKTIMLMAGNLDISILQDTTDTAGKFSFHLAGFNNGTPFNLLVSGNSVQENSNFILDPLIYPRFNTPPGLKQKFPVDEVRAIKKIEKFYTDEIISGKGWLPPVTVSGASYKANMNLSSGDVITKEMLRKNGINDLSDAVLRNGKFHTMQGYLMAGAPNGFVPSATDEPTVILDGIQVTMALSGDVGTRSPVMSYLKTIPVQNVDHVRILTGTSGGVYGVRGGHGVIEIYTTPSLENPVSSNGIKTIYPRGFDVAPAFEMPDYTNKQVRNSKNPDMRTIIYWNGNIITDNNGKATVNFFTADSPATYIATISGITSNGHKIFKTITISRK
jgi:hypothetical protein